MIVELGVVLPWLGQAALSGMKKVLEGTASKVDAKPELLSRLAKVEIWEIWEMVVVSTSGMANELLTN